MNESAPQGMTPHVFIEKWKSSKLKESAGSHEHFIDLCRLLGEKTPGEADPDGHTYTFEKGALKTGGGSGWADVWKRGCFAWEYKGKHGDLDKAFAQLQRYAIALENPPLLIVSDMERIVIHTNWTNTVQDKIEITLDELADARRRQPLKWAFSEADVEQLKPKKTRQELTEEVAGGFARLAQDLRARGHDPQRVAHFVNRLVFCMFAEDVNLLPNHMFKRMLEATLFKVEQFEEHCRSLFAAMRAGGPVGFERVEWFNGGLFDDDDTLPMIREDIKRTLDVARLDWSNIDPSIMGTLFERGLDPDKRSQLGAHYTDRDKIMLIVNPVIVEPLTREWEETKSKIEPLMERHRSHKAKAEQTKAYNEAQGLHRAFIEKLKNFRVLDPACGSGNFLYLSLLALKDLEHRVNLDAEALGLPREFPAVGPECVKGIEINPYAAELARVSVWIGEIQWMQRNGFNASKNPILKPLDTIECRDALLNEDGTEAKWPEADVIVGNPPFLGNKRMIEVLGEEYAEELRDAYRHSLTKGVDLVIYWFDKAWRSIASGAAKRAGLVGTQAVRRGTNQVTLRRIVDGGSIFDAWDDEPWIVEGAAVRVSLVCFSAERGDYGRLDGKSVGVLNADLSTGLDAASAAALPSNSGRAFQGYIKVGPFDIDEATAHSWLEQPMNPNGRPNADVLFPLWNGSDIAGHRSSKWIIDFGVDRSVEEAAVYELPFQHVLTHVKPQRDKVRRQGHRERWWIHGEARPGLRRALVGLCRYIVTPRVAKHRFFVWLPIRAAPDSRLVAIMRDDDTSFGLVHSKPHTLWSMRMAGRHGVGNDPEYMHTLCFETFPFPEGLTPDIPAAGYADDPRAIAIAQAAKRLNALRENWLNPEDLVERVPEVVSGYPDRIVPKDDKAAAILKKRTLTNLYNERPAWLDHAHKALDEAVAAAYGWPADFSDEEILERLFHLNQERAKVQAKK